MAKAKKNKCVTDSTRPVTAGATTPAKLPMQFSIPVHFPATSGPAKDCVSAQWFDENKPYTKLATNSRPSESLALPTSIDAAMKTQHPHSPMETKAWRTRAAGRPRRIMASAASPAVIDEAAKNQN